MTKFQNAILDSYELIVTESKNSPDAVSSIPIFAKGITQLDGISSEIKTLRIQQAKDLTGITEDKNELAEVVADYVIDVAGAVHSYAISINNNTLQTKVDYKANKVHTMTKAKLIDAAGIVLEEARKISQ